jgi:hypothetical protein
MSPAALLRALYHGLPRLALRLALAGLIIIALLYCGLRVYTVNLGRRSITLLDEAARIPIGASEDSILPLVARYGGTKSTPLPPTPTDDCVDKAACEYQNAHRPDYSYGFALSPFDVMSSPNQTGRVHHLLSILMIRTPSVLRDAISMRNWLVGAEISIRGGRVVSVGGYLYVEGRNRWLGNTWGLFAEMPDLDLRSRAYAVNGTFLTFPGNGGAGTIHSLTSAAAPEQFKSAQSFNMHCITGLVPCRCLSDLTPLAFQHLSRHPDVGSSIETDDCPYRLNPR